MFIWEAAKTDERLREKVKFREKGEETVEDGCLGTVNLSVSTQRDGVVSVSLCKAEREEVLTNGCSVRYADEWLRKL